MLTALSATVNTVLTALSAAVNTGKSDLLRLSSSFWRPKINFQTPEMKNNKEKHRLKESGGA